MLHVFFGLLAVALANYSCESFYVEWPLDFILQHKMRPKYITAECILSYVNKRMWKEAGYLINEGEDIDLAYLREQLIKIKQPIDKFLRKSELAPKETTLNPAFKWAQSKDYIFLDVKLAHRIDSPACETIENDKLDIQGDTVTLTGYCENSGQKHRVELSITLHGEVDASQSTLTKFSGRVSLELKKKDAPSAWPRLLKSPRPTNMHIWWELADKYRSEVDALRTREDI